MTITSPPIGYVANIFGFFSTSTRDMETKFGRMVDYDAVTLHCI